MTNPSDLQHKSSLRYGANRTISKSVWLYEGIRQKLLDNRTVIVLTRDIKGTIERISHYIPGVVFEVLDCGVKIHQRKRK